MKKQIPIIKTLIHSAVAVFATAVVSSAGAATVAFGDFNNDGLIDVAAITSPTTITVSLANPDGSYTVSAILSAPMNQTLTSVEVGDRDWDGKLDVIIFRPTRSGYEIHTWLGNGDGTFGSRTTVKGKGRLPRDF